MPAGADAALGSRRPIKKAPPGRGQSGAIGHSQIRILPSGPERQMTRGRRSLRPRPAILLPSARTKPLPGRHAFQAPLDVNEQGVQGFAVTVVYVLRGHPRRGDQLRCVFDVLGNREYLAIPIQHKHPYEFRTLRITLRRYVFVPRAQD
jgi:hypothetical protein